jgi:DNA-cytosine methyltransferase
VADNWTTKTWATTWLDNLHEEYVRAVDAGNIARARQLLGSMQRAESEWLAELRQRMTTDKTIGSIFSGAALVETGAEQAGYESAWRIEMDPAIAEVADANLDGRTIVARAQDVDPRRLDYVDTLWASPPCQAHSQARARSLPGRDDAEVGIVCLDYVRALRPRVFILENVPPYQHAGVFKRIVADLFELGYMVAWDILNSADFGVPQTRRRLILRAYRDGLVPTLPQPTAWRGWYSAIADMVDTLPESQFAPWQLARLPETLTECGVLLDSKNSNQEYGKLHRLATDPAITVMTDDRPSHMPRAFIAHPSADNDRFVIRADDEPVFTVTGTHGAPRAFLIGGGNTNKDKVDSKARWQDEPAFTVSASDTATASNRAFLVDCQNNGSPDEQGKRGLTIRQATEPVHTITASPNRRTVRAWLDAGRVVSMTPRALARFQSLPDSFQLPDKTALACKVIGNGVPCEMVRRLLEVA